MRFTATLLAGAFAIAASAASTTAEAPTLTQSADPVQSSIEACVDKCKPGDVDCLSRCNPVPNPNRDQVQKTHDCIAKCDQGDGTKAQTDKYAQCVSACVQENYFDASQGGTPKPTGGNGGSGGNDDSSSSDDSNASATITTGSGSKPTGSGSTGAAPTNSGSATESGPDGEASGTTSGAAATETGGDDAATGLVASSAALFGAIAAILAL